MRAMKDSGIEWIGQIPQEWNVQRGKYTFTVLSGFAFPSSDFSTSEGIPLIRIRDITSGITETFFKGEYSEEFLVNDGDLLIGMDGDFGIRIWDNGQALLNQRCCKIIANKDYSLKYLYYVLPYELKRINDLAFFTTVKHLSAEDLALVNVPLPSGDEQQQIADYLDAKCTEIDVLIAAKEKTNALLREQRQSIIYEAVTKGMNPNVPTKDSKVFWIGYIPCHWDVTRLKFYATIRTGFTLGKRYDASEELQEYPYLRVANVQGEYTDLTNMAAIHMPASEAEQYKLHAGELLMTEGGDRDKLGRGSVWHGEISDCLHQNHVFALATDEHLNVEYLSYLTTSSVGRDYFDFTAKKTTNLASTNATTILEFKIPFPSREEQDQIVAFLNAECSAIDELMARNNETISALKEYRQSVIYEAVTGKIEV